MPAAKLVASATARLPPFSSRSYYRCFCWPALSGPTRVGSAVESCQPTLPPASSARRQERGFPGRVGVRTNPMAQHSVRYQVPPTSSLPASDLLAGLVERRDEIRRSLRRLPATRSTGVPAALSRSSLRRTTSSTLPIAALSGRPGLPARPVLPARPALLGRPSVTSVRSRRTMIAAVLAGAFGLAASGSATPVTPPSGSATSGSATSGSATSGSATSGSATSGSATSGSATSGAASGSAASGSATSGAASGPAASGSEAPRSPARAAQTDVQAAAPTPVAAVAAAAFSRSRPHTTDIAFSPVTFSPSPAPIWPQLP